MKSLIAFLILSFISVCSFSQQKIESLNIDLENAKLDKEKVKILDDYSRYLISSVAPEVSLPYFEKLAKLSKKESDLKKERNAYKYISECYMRLNDSVKAYHFAQTALKKSDSTGNIEEYLIDSNQLGRAYDYFQDYDKAKDAYISGINHYEKLNTKNQRIEVLCQIYINLSQAFEGLGENDKVIETQLKGVKYAESINYPTGIAFGLYSIGWTYMELKEYEKAEGYFLKSLGYSDRIPSNYVNRNHHALGINYSRWGKIDEAIKHDSIALSSFKKEKDEIYVFDVLNNISEAYTKKGNYEKAILAGNEALNIAIKLNHELAINGVKQTLANAYIKNSEFHKAEQYIREVLKDTVNPKIIQGLTKASALENLSLILEKNNDHKSSLKYYKKFKAITDSLNEDIRSSKFADVETKYETEKKEKENLQLKADNTEQELLTQKANTRNWLLALGLIATALIAFLMWRRYKTEARAKRKISEQKDEIEHQKNLVEVLQKELHHRMKNNLSFIDLFINLAKGRFPDQRYQTKLNDLQNRIHSMFEVHKQLFKRDDVTTVKAKNYIDTLFENVQKSYAKNNITIVNKTHFDETLLANSSFPIGLIVNEFITNSYKYAFDEEDGVIDIALTSDDKQYHLSLKDNGKGLPEGFNINDLDSFGLETIQLLTKEYGGIFSLNNDGGVTINITLPKTAA